MTAAASGTTPLAEVLRVVGALAEAGVDTWLDGGWGVDALVGRQLRAHRDMDLGLRAERLSVAVRVLGALGYGTEVDELPTRLALIHADGARVDLHPLHFDSRGDAQQLAPDGGAWDIPARYFGGGTLGGQSVGCVTVEAQRAFHSGYVLREVDRLDLAALDLAFPPDPARGGPSSCG